MVLTIWMEPPKQELPVKSVDEFEIVLYEENMDLYEDMDFYEWLVEAGNGGSTV
jgi:hypothetical protein